MTGWLTEELVQRQQTPREYGEESAIPRVRDFGLNYIEITKHAYTRRWTATEIKSEVRFF
jgi:hypothetical protein